jgi:hypothetical protein
MEYVDQAWAFIQDLWVEVLRYLETGFGELNWTLPILIALWFGYQLGDWKKVHKSAFAATLLLVFLLVLPLRQGEDFKLPELVQQEFWKGLLAMFLAFILLILFFFALKKTVLKGGGGGH